MCKVICFDLDDTLFKEIEYLKSAYREIAIYATGHCSGNKSNAVEIAEMAYEYMLHEYQQGGNAFKALNSYLGLDVPLQEYLVLYREHRPEIKLPLETVDVLLALKAFGVHIGLITDGRSIQQRNKIGALGLQRFIEEKDIIISEEFGSEKPSKANFQYFMNRYPNAESYTYVGDNLKKDFIAPNILGWKTVCLKDDGRNVHKQDFRNIPENGVPQKVIETIMDLIK